ncbi:MAG: Mu-like prophage major head subunit gpT family protein [Halothiobacillaceae bacterium]|nr:Mu-like prophage major head subunit gpT family protein [Halothiobacillaceae bacterium]
MAILTPSLLTALSTGFRSDFQTAFSAMQAQSVYQRIATVVPSASASNTYGWLGQFPAFREWVGARTIKDMAAAGYQVVNKSWESTVGVKRTDIEDDAVGVYRPLMAEMGRAAAAFPDELVLQLLKAGESTLCFDGQNYFDSDHPVYPNADGTGAGSTISNLQAGTDPAWYLLDTTRALKPLLYQERKAPEFLAMTKVDDEAVFTSGEYRYGVDLRANAGFGFWQMAYKSKAALDATNYAAARAAMMSQRADGGRPLGIAPNLLLVPPALEAQARAIVGSQQTTGGATNPWYGTAEIIVSAHLE